MQLQSIAIALIIIAGAEIPAAAPAEAEKSGGQTTKQAAPPQPVVVDRPDLESVRDSTISLKRNWPWRPPSGEGRFDLDGLPDRDLDVEMITGAVFFGDKKVATA